jgi:hypothetical protein
MVVGDIHDALHGIFTCMTLDHAGGIFLLAAYFKFRRPTGNHKRLKQQQYLESF